MNKLFKSIALVTLAATMIAPTALSGCGKKQANDPETRPVTLSTQALDGNFNPFFATSAPDVEVVGQTQISMLASDENGDPVAGKEWPTVVLDYKQTMYTANNEITTTGDINGRTEYEFVIKKGIKFSDGEELTIKDVLFNLYVYLDPAYTGSNTMYSTNIKGLKAYREQDPTISDDSDVDSSDSFYATATQRITNIINYVTEPNEYPHLNTPEMSADIQRVKELYLEEVTSDWNRHQGTIESYEDEYRFTEDWEIYYYNEGIVSQKTKQNQFGAYEFEKDENGKYLTTLDDADNEYAEVMAEAMNDEAKIAEYMARDGSTREQAQQAIMKDTAIQTVYEAYTVYDAQIADILMYWATGSTIREEFVGEARTEHFNNILEGNNGELIVPTISGITVEKTSSFDGEHGQALDGEHDVLKIVINGVDPKAIWNFAFAVAPMHYYSNEEQCTLAEQGKGFGVKFNDFDFFKNVLDDSKKTTKPIGAGVYMASGANDETGDAVSGSTFYRNNYVYYLRNPYFETVDGGGDYIENAKIRKLRYFVVGEDKIILALKNGEIDYGMPSANPENVRAVSNESELLGNERWETAGYGYVGINPKYIPDENVRKAIMYAMNTNLIISGYYTQELAKPVYRPISRTSWAYPSAANGGEEAYYPYVGGREDYKEFIEDLVESSGWRKGSDEIYAKNGKKLDFTFTIAGG
ncbi:MAG: hypothetical protein E7370_01090, partial [Clostridiales bacterium]|nr:hypothetical protein [Clostridiales bacterium]